VAMIRLKSDSQARHSFIHALLAVPTLTLAQGRALI
jgi:hypothetical protein